MFGQSGCLVHLGLGRYPPISKLPCLSAQCLLCWLLKGDIDRAVFVRGYRYRCRGVDVDSSFRGSQSQLRYCLMV